MKLTSFRDKLSFIVLLITAGMDWLTFGLVFPIFSAFVYRPELHFLPAHVSSLERGIWLGALLAVGPGISFFSSTIFGTFSDQKGRKKALQWTLCIVTLGFAISTLGVLLKNLVVVFIGRMVMGIGGGNTAIVNAAIADTSTRQEKASRYGLVSMANGIGFTIGPALGGMLSHWGGYATPFALAGLVTFINLILLSFFLKESFQNKMRQHLHMRQEFKLLREAMRVSGIPILFCCFFIYSIGWSFYWEFIPVTWIEGYHLSTEEIGLLYAYGSLFYVVSSGLLIRPIIKRVAPLLILFAAWIFLGGTLIPLFIRTSRAFGRSSPSNSS